MYPICLVSCCANPLRLATCWPVRAGRIDEAIGRLNEGTAAAKGANFADYRTGGVPGTPYRSQWGYGDTMPIPVHRVLARSCPCRLHGRALIPHALHDRVVRAPAHGARLVGHSTERCNITRFVFALHWAPGTKYD